MRLYGNHNFTDVAAVSSAGFSAGIVRRLGVSAVRRGVYSVKKAEKIDSFLKG